MFSYAAAGFVSLNAAAAVGAGTSYPVVGCSRFGLQVVLGSGAPTSAIVILEGTLDTDKDDTLCHWFTLATWSKAAPLVSGDIVFAKDQPVAKIRANCTTLDVGANKTVLAKLSAAV